MIYRVKDSKYGDVFKLEEYNGQWSIQAAREGQDGKIWTQWVHPQGKNKTIIDRAIPLAVGRISKMEMIEMLTQFISDLKQDSGDVPYESQQVVDDPSIPF